MAEQTIEPGQNLTTDSLLVELGVSGLRYRRGEIQEEILRVLQGNKRLKVYAQMSSNDAVIGAGLSALKLIARSATWDFEAADDSALAAEAAEFARGALFMDMSHTFDSFLMEALSMLEHGFSYFEIVYKMRRGENDRSAGEKSVFNDGLWGWRKFAIRSQDTVLDWKFDENGGIRGLQQRDPNGKKRNPFIPIEKALLFRTSEHKGNPQGKAIIRNAYINWFYKTKTQELQQIGIERDLAGIPVAYIPAKLLHPNASSEERASLESIKTLVTNIRRNEQEGIVFPQATDENGKDLYKLELMSSGGGRQFDTTSVIAQHNREMALSMLTDFILIGHEATGSFALSDDKKDTLGMVIDAYLDSFADVFNRHCLPRLWFLNNKTNDTMPSLIHSEVVKTDIEAVTKLIETMSGAAMDVSDLNAELRRLGGLPQQPDDFEPIPAPVPEIEDDDEDE